MEFVIEGLLGLGVLVIALWLLSLRKSVAKDRAEGQRQQAQAKAQKKRAARNARLYRKGEPLRCLGCMQPLVGPMPEDGCPRCQVAALVVTEADFRKGQKAIDIVDRLINKDKG